MTDQMNALVADSPGSGRPARLRRVPVPVPGAGQVRIRVHAAALNALDTKIASGQVGLRRSPNILGFDAAGTVDAVGEGVERHRVGDRVFALTIANGSLAEFVVVDVGSYLEPVPEGLTLEAAAALPSAGASASALVQTAKLVAGERVLIVGASGGLGTFTVQFAAQAGARVLATGRAEDLELLAELGSSEAIDYRDGPLARSLTRMAPDGVDVLIDLAHSGPDLAAASELVAPRGRVVSPLDGPTSLPRQVTVSYPPVHPLPAGLLGRLAKAAAEGELTVVTDIRGTLADAEGVLEQFGSAHRRGKWVLKLEGTNAT
jgi:NADPH2:quinone reductase